MATHAPDRCPNCDSGLAQALRWAGLAVTLRCPECHSCFRADCTLVELHALETRQAEARAAIAAGYQRAGLESMRALAGTFEAALALDLLSADDFAPRSPAAP